MRSIGSAMGERLPIRTLQVREPERLAALEASGLRHFLKSGAETEELAYAAARTAMEASQLDPVEIGAVVYCTTMLTVLSTGSFSYSGVNRMLGRLGLAHAYPTGVFLSHCSNLVAGIRIARSLILSEGLRNVLVVSADRIGSDDDSRFLKDDLSFLSDGACACVLGGMPAKFSIDAVAQHVDAGIPESRNFIQTLKLTSEGIRRTWEMARKSARMGTENLKAVITGNYNLNTQHFIRTSLGIAPEMMFLENIQKNAHAFSADLLMNFEAYLSGKGARPGEKFLLFGSGNERWGAVILTCLEEIPIRDCAPNP